MKRIDGFPPLDPLYPNHPIAGVTAALFDAPEAPFGAVPVGGGDLEDCDIEVLFESALVCVNEAAKKICYIGSFFWGYENDGALAPQDPDGVTGIVTGFAPCCWSPGLSLDFKAQFAAEYPLWTLMEGSCIIPEPSGLMLVAFGLVVLLARRPMAAFRKRGTH